MIKESEGHISKPVCDFYRKAYIWHSVDYFFPFLADSYFFLPDWGLWWENDNRNEKNKLDCFFSDSRWSHPDPPERIWWKRQRNKTITRLEKEVQDNEFWKKEYPKNRLFSPWADCVWKKRSDPFVNPFYVTKFKKKKEDKKKSNGGGNTQNNNNKKSFTMSDKLKTALCTQGQLTPEQLDNIVESARDF